MLKSRSQILIASHTCQPFQKISRQSVQAHNYTSNMSGDRGIGIRITTSCYNAFKHRTDADLLHPAHSEQSERNRVYNVASGPKN